MKTLEGKASDILRDYADGKYEVHYKSYGYKITDIELYDKETKDSYLPTEEVKYYLEIILDE